MEDLWRRFQDALKNYTEATEDRKIAFETLKVKDEKSSKEIEMQMKKIQKLQVSARQESLSGVSRALLGPSLAGSRRQALLSAPQSTHGQWPLLSLQEAIAALKGKITAYSREGEWQNQCIRNDKELVHVQLRKLKAQRTQARGKSQENLVKLTLESNAALKGLKKVVEKVKGTNQETWLEAKGIRETWGGAPSSSLVKWRMSVFAFLLMLFSF